MFHPHHAIHRDLVSEQPLAIYLHIPFCQTRCTYCAFNTYTGQVSRITPYMAALGREAELVAGSRPAYTLYFGGGTPSLVPADQIAAVVRRCAGGFTLSPDAEITLEANPGTVDQIYLSDLRRAGVNRLSIGMQSSNADELKLFARGHDTNDVRATVHWARQAGFENISLDLIYGAPNQTMSTWQASLETALDIAPDHLSLYGLGVEDGTPMQRWIAHGEVPTPDSDLAADMYEWALERLASAGFEQYEISNWARPGFVCRHNVHYWLNLPYLGLGAGAHGYAAHTRYMNVLHPAAYIERVTAQTQPSFPLTAAAEDYETIDDRAAMTEMMLMGLRLVRDGVSFEDFRTRYGRDLWSVYPDELNRLIAVGLLEVTDRPGVRLTARGKLLGNHVFTEFV